MPAPEPSPTEAPTAVVVFNPPRAAAWLSGQEAPREAEAWYPPGGDEGAMLPEGLTARRLPRRGPGRADLPKLARRAADEAADAIRELSGAIGGRFPALRDTLRARLTYRAAYRTVPTLLDAWAALDARRGPVVLLDAPLSSDLAARLARSVLGRRSGPLGPVSVRSSLGDEEVSGLAKRYARLGRRAAGLEIEPVRGGAVVFVGGAGDLESLVPAARALGARTPVAVVLKAGAEGLEDRCREVFSEGGRRVAVAGLGAFASHGIDPDEAGAVAATVERALAPDEGSTPRIARTLANDLLGALTLVLQAEGLARALEPSLVIGAFEKSPLGAAVPAARRVAAFRVINIQHGIVPRARTLDLMPFDDFVVWNRATAKMVRRDGLPRRTGVRVLGNPAWDRLRAEVRGASVDPAFDAWRDGRTVLAAFTQPPNALFIPAGVCTGFLAILSRYAKARPGVALLIKRHGRDDGACDPPELAQLVERGVARVASSADMTLGAALRVADAATSVSSTVLTDAAAVGLPVVAIDTERSLRRIPYPVGRSIRVAHTERSAFACLDAALAGRRPAPDRNLFPALYGSYEDRWRDLLAS